MTVEDGTPSPVGDGSWLTLLVQRTVRSFLEHGCPNLAAGIAYYVLFSIFPLVLGLTVVLGAIIDAAELQARVVDALQPYWPGSTHFMEEAIREVVEGSGSMGTLAAVGLFGSATAMLSAIRAALNQVWGVTEARPLWRRKARELAAIAVVGVFLLASFLLATGVRIVVAFLPAGAASTLALLTGSPVFLWFTALVSFLVTFAVFILAYRRLPNTLVRWREAATGAFVASLLFEAAGQGFVIYLERFASYNVVYGPLAGVIVFLLWAYIFSLILILLLGAEVASESRWVWE